MLTCDVTSHRSSPRLLVMMFSMMTQCLVYFRGQTLAKVWRVFTRFVIPPRLLSVGGGGRPAERLQLQSVRGPFLGLGSRNGVTAV